ncbi:MAG: hypothetical protein ACRDDP_08165 [Plesiomonas sp.]|uniref:hypothetical protein n=2 Tax=Plesiomonas sp. TaxID=2486279 RepID=UPI003EE66994
MISKKKTHLIIYSLLLINFSSSASCWLVGDIKGYNGEGHHSELYYGAERQSKFIVKISDKLTKITPSNLNFISIGNKTAAGVYDEGNVTTIESWSISTDEKKVFISRVRTGNTNAEGAEAFQGNVISRCE